MQMRFRRYFKYRHENRLYTREQARELGKTSLDEGGNNLFVRNGRGWSCWMHLQQCAYGQKYVEDDTYLKARDKAIRKAKEK